MTLHVRNPHSVLAALETRPQDVLQIVAPPSLEKNAGGEAAQGRDAWLKVIQVAKTKGIKIGSAPQAVSAGGGKGQQQRGGQRGHHRDADSDRSQQDAGRASAAEALIKERQGLSAEELFRGAKDRAGGKGLWLALDSLTDPQNVGAIFRAASFFGVQGIMLTADRSASLTSAVYDVACGGVEYVPFTVQTSLQHGFEVAKEAGLWILGTSEHAKQSFRKVERDRPWLLVVGNEEKGMRRLTEESCDVVCQIPPVGKVTSLNVSVATGILISSLTS